MLFCFFALPIEKLFCWYWFKTPIFFIKSQMQFNIIAIKSRWTNISVFTTYFISRLKSRKPFYNDFNLTEAWRNEWRSNNPRGGETIADPSQQLPGFQTSSRKEWVTANRLRTRHAKTAINMHRWGLFDSPLCPRCKQAPQDTDHLVMHCPETHLEGGYQSLSDSNHDFKAWIKSKNVGVW